jgi:GNAT superfamily N-acetyltransferase
VAHTIRPFEPTDAEYEAVVAVHNATNPGYADTPGEWRHFDEVRDPKHKFQRYVALTNGQIVGFANYFQPGWAFHPRKFGVSVSVHPECQGRGIGSALYDTVMEALAPFEPLLVRTRTREDWARGVRFILDRGFVEDMREWESHLDVAAFDPAPFAGAERKMREHGIEIKSMVELADDPDRDRKIYELDIDVARDVPSPDPFTPMEFERFHEMVFKNPGLIPDAWLVAVDGDEYVGVSTLWKSEASADLFNGLTGVRRDHRRKGIALGLKLRNIAYAKSIGAPVIKTWNESNNRAMLGINEALGFAKQPAWVNYHKDLKASADEANTSADGADGSGTGR